MFKFHGHGICSLKWSWCQTTFNFNLNFWTLLIAKMCSIETQSPDSDQTFCISCFHTLVRFMIKSISVLFLLFVLSHKEPPMLLRVDASWVSHIHFSMIIILVNLMFRQSLVLVKVLVSHLTFQEIKTHIKLHDHLALISLLSTQPRCSQSLHDVNEQFCEHIPRTGLQTSTFRWLYFSVMNSFCPKKTFP